MLYFTTGTFLCKFIYNKYSFKKGKPVRIRHSSRYCICRILVY